MGGRKCVSAGPLATWLTCTSGIYAVTGMPRVMGKLNASGTLPHWHWQEDLQQSCLPGRLLWGVLACEALVEDALCRGQASWSPLTCIVAGMP